MATNLRLRPDAEKALRAASERSGRSQQDIIREAIDRYLTSDGTAPSPPDPLLASGRARKPRTPLSRPLRRMPLPPGTTSLELLDRDDRF